MYRYELDGQEIIIMLSSILEKKEINRNSLYKQVHAVGDKVLKLKDESAFMIDNSQSLVIANVKHGSLIVVTIEQIVERDNIFSLEH